MVLPIPSSEVSSTSRARLSTQMSCPADPRLRRNRRQTRLNIIWRLVRVARRQVRQRMVRLVISHHFLDLQGNNITITDMFYTVLL